MTVAMVMVVVGLPRSAAEAARAHSVAPPATRAAHIDMETRSLTLLALCVTACAEPLVPLEPLWPLQRAIKDRSDAHNTYANEFTQEYEPVAFAAIPLSGPMPIIAVLSENPITQAKQLQQALATSLKQVYAKPDYQQNNVPTDYSPYAKPYEEYQKPYEYPKYPKPPYVTEYPKHYSSIEFAKPAYPPVEYAKPYPVEYAKPYPVEYAKPYPVEYAKPYTVEYTKPYSPEYAPYRLAEYTKPYPEEYVKPYASVESPTILYARPNENGGYSYSRRPLKKRNVRKPRKQQKPVILRVHKYRVIRSRRSGY